jgi:hypothetical protein
MAVVPSSSASAPSAADGVTAPRGALLIVFLTVFIDLLGFGITSLPTAAQGDCGLDVMAYWDGVDRTPSQWKSLRLEVGVAIEGLASDPQWHTVFVECAELPSPDTTALVRSSEPSPTAKPPPGHSEISAALAVCCDPGALELQDRSDMAAALA